MCLHWKNCPQCFFYWRNRDKIVLPPLTGLSLLTTRISVHVANLDEKNILASMKIHECSVFWVRKSKETK